MITYLDAIIRTTLNASLIGAMIWLVLIWKGDYDSVNLWGILIGFMIVFSVTLPDTIKAWKIKPTEIPKDKV